MAERVPKITEEQKPTFDAAVYSDRLQETRVAPGALPAVQVFDKTKPASIVSLAQYVRGKLTDTVNALSDFTAAQKKDLDIHGQAIIELRADVQALKEAPAARPFP